MPLINGVTPLLGFLLLEDSKKDTMWTLLRAEQCWDYAGASSFKNVD
jgi:hypothetical protein